MSLLAFGDPIVGSSTSRTGLRAFANLQSVERIPSTAAEVKSIATFFDSANVHSYLDTSATERRFKNENLHRYRYIHFATHGFLDEKVPSRRGVLFSSVGDTTEDGLLQMNEIINLDMNPDLVVLSACETGLGKLVRGEGMIGLTRSFHYAGARSLVVSLWKVADNSTAALMKGLYSSLAQSGSPTTALREAKLQMLKSPTAAWRHPFHWAAFVVQGKGD